MQQPLNETTFALRDDDSVASIQLFIIVVFLPVQRGTGIPTYHHQSLATRLRRLGSDSYNNVLPPSPPPQQRRHEGEERRRRSSPLLCFLHKRADDIRTGLREGGIKGGRKERRREEEDNRKGGRRGREGLFLPTGSQQTEEHRGENTTTKFKPAGARQEIHRVTKMMMIIQRLKLDSDRYRSGLEPSTAAGEL